MNEKNMNKNEGTKECMSFTPSCMLTNLQTQSITKQMLKTPQPPTNTNENYKKANQKQKQIMKS